MKTRLCTFIIISMQRLKKLGYILKLYLKQPRAMKKAQPILVGGFVSPGFEQVSETFRANIQSGLEKGGSFAAYYKGDLVVNLWGGYCDFDCRRPWKEDTLSTFFSSTKAVAAVVIGHLVDSGRLDYQERVCKYWPEFAQNGKGEITLEQLISNQAGLISLDVKFWLSEMRDNPEGLGRKLAAQKPYWTPGTKHGYHPLTFGLYLDQIVRHADVKGRNLSQYFQEEIAEPFGIEFYIGLPKPLQYRGSRIKFTRELDNAEFLRVFRGDLEYLMKTVNNPQDFKTVLKMNDPDIRELPIPSTHGHGTTANMAKIFGIIADGGCLNDKRMLSEAAIRRFTKPVVAGYDVSFGIDCAWSLGMQLINVVEGDKPVQHIFGHGGYGGQYAAADIYNNVGFAYTTSHCDPFSSYSGDGDPRMYSLYEALYDSIRKIENITVPRQTFKFYSGYKKYLEESGKGVSTSKL